MPVIFLYLFKLSLSLAVVYLFYHFVLRRLTFYNWNRFYLIAYTALSFFIPFINITPVLERNELINNRAVQFIPSVNAFADVDDAVGVQATKGVSLSSWDWILLFFATGILIMLLRMLLQLLSFRGIVNKAKLISVDKVKLYQVEDPIIPFSFGNSIFVNRQQHDESELEEIIRHEFVHIQQKHTIDIICSEVLCIINWYNPFVWLVRKAIRQNLEFIADDNVLQSGIDRKQYQYLLLKVTGNNYFSIASQFNFSSLKKRIAMMNRMKSARVQLAKFLFLVPLIAILLVAFRNNNIKPLKEKKHYQSDAIEDRQSKMSSDTIPANSKLYIIEMIINKKGDDTTIVVRDKNKKELKRLLLPEWNKKKNYYESLYGPLSAATGVTFNQEASGADIHEPSRQYDQNLLKGNTQPMVILDGIEQPENTDPGSLLEPAEIFEMTVWNAEDAIARYGYNAKNGVIVLTSRAYAGRTVGKTVSTTITSGINEAPTIAATSNSVTVEEKPVALTAAGSATKELPGKPSPVSAENIRTTIPVKTTVSSTSKATVKSAAIASGKPVQITTETKSSVSVTNGKNATESVSTVKKIIVLLKSSTTEAEVKKIESDLKTKGYDFKINKVEFKEGKLVLINGTISRKSKKQYFTASDFAKLVITDVPEEDKDNRFNFMVISGNLNVSDKEQ